MTYPTSRVSAPLSVLPRYLDEAARLARAREAETGAPSPALATALPDHGRDYRWFLLPEEAAAELRGQTVPATAQRITCP